MVQFVQGEVNLVLPPSLFSVNSNKLYLECRTSIDACIINLPALEAVNKIASNWGFWISINDYDKNADVNNIAVVCAKDDFINGKPFIIMNQKGRSASLYITSPVDWALNVSVGARLPSGYGVNEILPVTFNGQRQFELGNIPLDFVKPELVINGSVQLLNTDYIIEDRLLTWRSEQFELSTSDSLNIYY